MAKKLHLVHVKSNVLDKAPSASTLNYGEIAVNYNADSPALYIRDDEDNIVKFISEPYFEKIVGTGITENGSEVIIPISEVIQQDEEVVAAALNDLNDRKADKSYVDEAVSSITIDIDTELDTGLTSTNPVENRAITKVILENEETIAAALNDLETKKANKTDVQAADQYLQEQIDNITAGGLTGVVTAGTGNVVTKIEKDGNNVKATLGATMLEKSAFDTYTANTKNEFITSAITANTEYVEHLTANTINATAVTATTVSATTYNNLPTASTTNYGMVILDDHLDSGSTNAVMNSAITMVILEDEETVAAALNDLETRKANKTDVNNALEDHETRITNLEDAIETIEGGGLTGVTTTGTGNVITGLTKSGNSVVGHLGTITADDRVLNTTFNTYTASTQTTMTGKADKTYVDSNFFHSAEYYSSGSTHEIRFKDASGNTISTVNADDFIKDGMVDNVQISGSSLVITFNTDSGKSPISIPLVNIFNPDNYYNKTQVDNLLAGKSNTGHTHTAAELPTASTTNLGIVKVDDALSTGSTNPVQNKVITQTILDNELVVAAALNDLNNRKANIEDIPVTISDLSDGGDVAMKTDLSGFLPLSGVTETGSGNAVTGVTVNHKVLTVAKGNISGGSVGTLNTTATSAQATSASESFENNITLHKVSKTGNYNDLLNKPTVITGVTINSAAKTVTNGVVDLGTVVTAQTSVSTGTSGNGNVLTNITLGGTNNHTLTLVKGVTIPAWATASTKPSYTASEVGALASSATLDNVPDGTTRKLSNYISGVTMNNSARTVSNGVVDLGTVITAQTQLSTGATQGGGNVVTSLAVSNHQITLTKGITIPAWATASTKPSYTASEVGALATSATYVSSVTVAGTSVVNNRVAAIPSANTNTFGVVKVGSFLSNSNGTISVSTGTSSSTVAVGNHTHSNYATTTNLNTHTGTTISGRTSGQMHLPTVSASDNGKILRVVNGAWALVDPATIYYGSGTPAQSLGNDGDIYIQTS